ncbi:cytochrome c oxidase assembly protein [Chitinilyticum piscinae]|uniref:Cytochrome c oxidase assembly protein CtaG n=1 Tax=Chitinilyticum piscinae TaxID=2866724 RepID=A0A8J7G1Y4_9NEIS|nr:cytochrome c oxidase assembly protein [Chitinilyticum piscinae]MBE9610490.1 cytochrome c oxidase assembly protein [Chitinilyticum piscinae]
MRNRRLAWKLGLTALIMSGFGLALAPLYDRLCRVLGLDRARAELASSSEVLRVEFDTNVAAGLPVRFTALTPVTVMHPGSRLQGRFLLENYGKHPVTIRAIPSFAPLRAAGVLHKIDCFCFNGMTLAAGETREVSVLLQAGPLPEGLGAATLSYVLQGEAT